MKTKSVLSLLFSVLCLAAFAATYTKQNTRVNALHVNVDFDKGTATSTAVKITAYLQQVLINDTDTNDYVPAARGEVTFDLLDPTLNATTITAAGKTVTYPQLAAFLRQASLDRANAQGVP
jgi:hypothetical protein